jgi:hypothetical protein
MIALSLAASPAAAQDDEPALGVSTGAEDDAPALGVSTGAPEDDAPPLGVSTEAAEDDAPALGVSTTPPDSGAEDAASADESASEESEETEDAASDDVSDEDASDEDASDEDAEESASEDEEAPPAPHWTDERTAAWATFITSFALAIGGGVLLAIGVDEVNTIENAADGTVWTDVASSLDRAPIFTGVGAVVLGLGIAGTITGATLLALYGGEGTWLEVSVLPGGLSARGRF